MLIVTKVSCIRLEIFSPFKKESDHTTDEMLLRNKSLYCITKHVFLLCPCERVLAIYRRHVSDWLWQHSAVVTTWLLTMGTCADSFSQIGEFSKWSGQFYPEVKLRMHAITLTYSQNFPPFLKHFYRRRWSWRFHYPEGTQGFSTPFRRHWA